MASLEGKLAMPKLAPEPEKAAASWRKGMWAITPLGIEGQLLQILMKRDGAVGLRRNANQHRHKGAGACPRGKSWSPCTKLSLDVTRKAKDVKTENRPARADLR